MRVDGDLGPGSVLIKSMVQGTRAGLSERKGPEVGFPSSWLPSTQMSVSILKVRSTLLLRTMRNEYIRNSESTKGTFVRYYCDKWIAPVPSLTMSVSEPRVDVRLVLLDNKPLSTHGGGIALRRKEWHGRKKENDRSYWYLGLHATRTPFMTPDV